jgi:histidine ammonia-lyase
MAMGAVLKLKQVLVNLERILAIEFLCAAQGVDYLRPLKAGATVEVAYQHIRSKIAHVSTDRVLSKDIEQMLGIMMEDPFMRYAHNV